MATSYKNTGFEADEFVEFYGKKGTIIDFGTLSTARDGLQTGRAVFQIPRAFWGNLPSIGTVHPVFRHISAESSEISISGVYAVSNCEYFGIATPESVPVYDMSDDVAEDPIATHPDFLAIAGDANNPKNGANFRKPGVNGAALLHANNKAANADEAAQCVFDHFDISKKGVLNEFAGIESYFTPNIVWRKTWYRRDPLTDLSMVGKIDNPEGPAPTLGGKRNWLLLGIKQTKKGACYQCEKVWRASGPRGWNGAIYGVAKKK